MRREKNTGIYKYRKPADAAGYGRGPEDEPRQIGDLFSLDKVDPEISKRRGSHEIDDSVMDGIGNHVDLVAHLRGRKRRRSKMDASRISLKDTMSGIRALSEKCFLRRVDLDRKLRGQDVFPSKRRIFWLRAVLVIAALVMALVALILLFC